MKKISVVIRTYNEEEFIDDIVNALRNQKKYGKDLELIFVDIGSIDSTVKKIKKHKVKLVQVKGQGVDYSGPLNLGIKMSKGDIICIMSAHTLPLTHDWILNMVKDFEDDEIAGVYCRQLPKSNAPWYEIERLNKQFNSYSRVYNSKNSSNVNFSNAASFIRRDAWKKQPFKSPLAEDREWAQWALNQGYKIKYNSNACVYHSHLYSPRTRAIRKINGVKANLANSGLCSNLVLILKHGFGWFVRDLRKILFSDYCKNNRLKYSLQVLESLFWYFVKFKDK